MRESIRLARAVFSQPSFAPFCAGEMEPGAEYNTDAELDDFAARKGDSSYHPSCTCRMGDASEGGRDGAVVDAKTMGVIGGFFVSQKCEGFFEHFISDTVEIDTLPKPMTMGVIGGFRCFETAIQYVGL